ncbi:RNase A-like domain-containing protein [Lysinibacillus sp. NPDC093190]|uniref:RNase A-like domain-containing protein n=1 Tax=Lysinibacillus sp. NPDC093190 TaxID=3390575 RepID=UPI003D028976
MSKFANVIIDKFGINEKTSKKLKDALVKTSAEKIKKMSVDDTKKLINSSEGKGNDRGHTLATHMNITDEALQARSKTKDKTGASKFTNHKVMQEFVNNVLDDEADHIAKWLKSDKKDDFTSRKHKSKTPLGYGYKFNKQKNEYKRSDKLDTGIVVLKKDDSNEYGFIVKTAYPYVK